MFGDFLFALFFRFAFGARQAFFGFAFFLDGLGGRIRPDGAVGRLFDVRVVRTADQRRRTVGGERDALAEAHLAPDEFRRLELLALGPGFAAAREDPCGPCDVVLRRTDQCGAPVLAQGDAVAEVASGFDAAFAAIAARHELRALLGPAGTAVGEHERRAGPFAASVEVGACADENRRAVAGDGDAEAEVPFAFLFAAADQRFALRGVFTGFRGVLEDVGLSAGRAGGGARHRRSDDDGFTRTRDRNGPAEAPHAFLLGGVPDERRAADRQVTRFGIPADRLEDPGGAAEVFRRGSTDRERRPVSRQRDAAAEALDSLGHRRCGNGRDATPAGGCAFTFVDRDFTAQFVPERAPDGRYVAILADRDRRPETAFGLFGFVFRGPFAGRFFGRQRRQERSLAPLAAGAVEDPRGAGQNGALRGADDRGLTVPGDRHRGADFRAPAFRDRELRRVRFGEGRDGRVDAHREGRAAGVDDERDARRADREVGGQHAAARINGAQVAVEDRLAGA